GPRRLSQGPPPSDGLATARGGLARPDRGPAGTAIVGGRGRRDGRLSPRARRALTPRPAQAGPDLDPQTGPAAARAHDPRPGPRGVLARKPRDDPDAAHAARRGYARGGTPGAG